MAKKNTLPEKENKAAEYVLLLMFFVFLILLSTTKLNGEDDLFWHMATGKFIVENKYIPDTDVFGHITGGMQWIPFEWLWDVLAFSIFSITGFTGLYILTYILTILIFYLLYIIIRKFGISPAYTIIFLFIVALGIKYRIGLKPQMFTYLFFVLVLKLITDYKYFSGNVKKIYFIPVIFLLWANIHMGVLAGVLIPFILFISELLTNKKSKLIKHKSFRIPDNNSLKITGIVFILSAAAMLINPHHINTYIYSISHTGMKLIDHIFEWYSPFHANFSGKLFIIIYIIFLAGIIPVLFYSFKQKDYFSLILVPLFAAYSLRAVRFTTDYILVSAIFIIISVHYYLNSKRYSINFSREKKPVIMIAGIILLVSIIMTPDNSIFRFIGFNSDFGMGIYERTFPVKMYNFIGENKINETGKRPFQLLDNGGFYLWNFPGSKNFIDSRNLNDSIYFAQLKIKDRKPGFAEAINEYKIDHFMMFNPMLAADNKFLGTSVISYLSQNADAWKPVYWDDQSVLFVKNSDEFRDIISTFEYKYFTQYNLIFNKQVIEKALKEDKETLLKEVQRRRNEEPNSYYLNVFMQTYGRQLGI